MTSPESHNPEPVPETAVDKEIGWSLAHREQFDREHPFVSPDVLPVAECLSALRNFPSAVEYLQPDSQHDRWSNTWLPSGRYMSAGGQDIYSLYGQSSSQAYIDFGTPQEMTITHVTNQPNLLNFHYPYDITLEEAEERSDQKNRQRERYSELEMTEDGVRIKTLIRGWETGVFDVHEVIYETLINDPEDCRHLLECLNEAPFRLIRIPIIEAQERVEKFFADAGVELSLQDYLEERKS